MAFQKQTKPFAVKGQNMTTPKGKALWCKITEPDRAYNDKGEFSTSLICDPNDPAVAKFVEKLEELRDIALNETKETMGQPKANQVKARSVFTEELDDSGEATGNIIFRMKMKNIDDRKADGKQSEIVVVDAKRNRIQHPPLIGNGSVIRSVVYANPYYMANTKEVGISLIWDKMQLIDLVEYSGGGSDGFDDEDGFESTESEDASGFDNEDDDF